MKKPDEFLKSYGPLLTILFVSGLCFFNFALWNDGANYIMNVFNGRWFWRDPFSFRWVEYIPQIIPVALLKNAHALVLTLWIYKWFLIAFPLVLVLLRWRKLERDEESQAKDLILLSGLSLFPLVIIFPISALGYTLVGGIWIFAFLLQKKPTKIDFMLYLFGHLLLAFGYETGLLVSLVVLAELFFFKKDHSQRIWMMITEFLTIALTIFLFTRLPQDNLSYMAALEIRWDSVLYAIIFSSCFAVAFLFNSFRVYIVGLAILALFILAGLAGANHFYAMVWNSRLVIIPGLVFIYFCLRWRGTSNWTLKPLDFVLGLLLIAYPVYLWGRVEKVFESFDLKGCQFVGHDLVKPFSPPVWTFPNLSLLFQLHHPEVHYILLSNDHAPEDGQCSFIRPNTIVMRTKDYRYGLNFYRGFFNLNRALANAREFVLNPMEPLNFHHGLSLQHQDRLLISNPTGCLKLEFDQIDTYYGAYRSGAMKEPLPITPMAPGLVVIKNISGDPVEYYPMSQQRFHNITTCKN